MFGQGQEKQRAHTPSLTSTWGEDVTAKHGQKTQGNDNVATHHSRGVRDLMVKEQRDNTCVCVELGMGAGNCESPVISVAAIVGSRHQA